LSRQVEHQEISGTSVSVHSSCVSAGRFKEQSGATGTPQRSGALSSRLNGEEEDEEHGTCQGAEGGAFTTAENSELRRLHVEDEADEGGTVGAATAAAALSIPGEGPLPGPSPWSEGIVTNEEQDREAMLRRWEAHSKAEDIDAATLPLLLDNEPLLDKEMEARQQLPDECQPEADDGVDPEGGVKLKARRRKRQKAAVGE